jgi:hypothetical protein
LAVGPDKKTAQLKFCFGLTSQKIAGISHGFGSLV